MKKNIIEVWRAIQGYESIYEVSNFGRVKSVDRDIECKNRWGKLCIRRLKGKILNPCNKVVYLEVILSDVGVKKTYNIHKLVAQAFIPNPHNYKTVHHKNHNHQDNRACNLEWIDKDEHYSKHRQERIIKFGKIVYQYTLDNELVKVYPSIHEAARQFGCCNSNICNCCNSIG